MRSKLGLDLARGMTPKPSSSAVVAGGVLASLAAAFVGAAWSRSRGRAQGAEVHDEGRALDALGPRHRFRCAGVVVHERFGVPSFYGRGSLRVEVRAEHLCIRRPWARDIEIHWSHIESVQRERRHLGARVTRISRGFDRPRIDLELEVDEHAWLEAWWRSRAGVERFAWSVASVHELRVGDRAGGWALGQHGEEPWLFVRAPARSEAGGGRHFTSPSSASPSRWHSRLWVERFVPDRRLNHVHMGGRGLRLAVMQLGESWARHLAALPEVVRLVSEADDRELVAKLEGAGGLYR